MKRILLFTTLLALSASPTSAAPGVNLRWTNCFGDGGAINRNFACDTNVGSHVLVGSIELAADILMASGQEIVIDLAAAAPSLPAWWQFRTMGTCRQTSLGMNFVLPGTAVNCLDWANGQGAGGIGAYHIGSAGPNSARIVAAEAVPIAALTDLFYGTEYFVFNLVLNNAKTVGSDACAGCTTPVCIVYAQHRVTTPIAANDRRLSGPTNGTDSFFAMWQGGGVPVTWRGIGCPAATPTRSSTWGAVKSLYR